jgi:hypothetical protein
MNPLAPKPAIVKTADNLVEMRQQVKELAAGIKRSEKVTLEKAVEAGGLLVQIRAKTPRGRWLPTLTEMGISRSRAYIWIKIWELPEDTLSSCTSIAQAQNMLRHPDGEEQELPEEGSADQPKNVPAREVPRCDKCKRLHLHDPKCPNCIILRSQKPSDPKAASLPPSSANGREKWSWREVDSLFAPISQLPIRIAQRYPEEDHSNEYCEVDRLSEELLRAINRWKAKLQVGTTNG